MVESGSLIVGVPGCPDGPGVADERSIAAQDYSFGLYYTVFEKDAK